MDRKLIIFGSRLPLVRKLRINLPFGSGRPFLGKKSQGGKTARYLLFRLDSSGRAPFRRLYLTEGKRWSVDPLRARKGGLSAMRALMAGLKAAFPDIILEKDG
jgi:hypothetical protein